MIGEQSLSFICEECDIQFETRSILERHIEKEHTNRDEWNCNDCAFQAHSADELMKHLKIKSHQPSPIIQNKKLLFKDYKQCYTCSLEFDGFRNLMEHRKREHPSNKKCRNYPEGPEGRCFRGKTCWYVHEEQLMDVDESLVSENSIEEVKFKCNFCGKMFGTKNDFMRHKKLDHAENVSNCEKFEKGTCSRDDSQCWFRHQRGSQEHPQEKQQVFQEVSKKPFPPEKTQNVMEIMKNWISKVEKMEEKLEKLVK